MVNKSLITAVHESPYLCWSKMQAEAGQALDTIIARKETERKDGRGVFFWGVGTSPSQMIPTLVKQHTPVPVVFSVMKGPPRPEDTKPSRVVRWQKYVTADGLELSLPGTAMITSRGDGPRGPKTKHFALVCQSENPLVRGDYGPFDPGAYVNASLGGRPVGGSQVTALLRRNGPSNTDARYRINLVAWLTDGYWVQLHDPVEVSSP